MIGLVVVTHGQLAKEFIKAAEHVVGPQPNMSAVCIEADDDMEKRRNDILQAAIAVDDDSEGTIILTDMFGGTPSNLAISVMEKANAEVIAGVNLPMLIKLAPEQYRRETNLQDAVKAAHESGRKYINVASWLLAGTNA